MIDIQEIQPYPVAPPLERLQDSNTNLKLDNDSMKKSNIALRSTLIIVFISLGVIGVFQYVKHTTKKDEKE